MSVLDRREQLILESDAFVGMDSGIDQVRHERMLSEAEAFMAPTPGERAMHLFNQARKTVTGAAADVSRSMAAMRYENDRRWTDLGNNVRKTLGKAPKNEDETALQEYTAWKFGEFLDEVAAEEFPDDPELQKSFFWTTLPQAASSYALYAASFWAGGPGAAGALGVSQAAGQAAGEAVDAGAPDELAVLSSTLAAPVGASEMLPLGKLASRFNKITKGGFGRLIGAMASGAVEEAGQEIPAQIAMNAIGRLSDRDRKFLEGVAEAGSAGGILGGLANAIVAGAKMRKLGRARKALEAVQKALQERPLVQPAAGPQPAAEVVGPPQTASVTRQAALTPEGVDQLLATVPEQAKAVASLTGPVSRKGPFAQLAQAVDDPEFSRMSASERMRLRDLLQEKINAQEVQVEEGEAVEPVQADEVGQAQVVEEEVTPADDEATYVKAVSPQSFRQFVESKGVDFDAMTKAAIKGDKTQQQALKAEYDKGKATAPETDLLGQVERSVEQAKDDPARMGVVAQLSQIAPQAKKSGKTFKSTLMRRLLTAAGRKPTSWQEAQVRHDGRMAVSAFEIERLHYRLQNEVAAAFQEKFGRAMRDEERVAMNRLMTLKKGEQLPAKDKALVDQFPDEVIDAATAMQDYLVAGSRALIEYDVVGEELAATIQENEGTWLHRSYRVFDDPEGWNKVRPKEINDKFMEYLRERFPDANADELIGLFKEFESVGKKAGNVLGVVQNPNVNARARSILMKRGNLDERLRAFWGEYSDPWVNFLKSAMMQAQVIADHRMLTEIRDAGLSEGWLRDAPFPRSDLFTKIETGSKFAYRPVEGLYTTEEIAAEFAKQTKEPGGGRIWNALIKGNFIGKYLAVIGNFPSSGVRNLQGNMAFAMMNGHWRFWETGEVLKIMQAELFNLESDAYDAQVKRLRELGMLGQGVASNEFRADMKDLLKSSPDAWAKTRLTPIKKYGLKAKSGAEKFFRFGDDFWKVFGYYNELTALRKAKPQWTQERLEGEAARRVHMTYMDYSQLPDWVKALRKGPAISPFIAFPWETMRVTVNQFKLLSEEMADPDLRKRGAERMVGMMLAAASTEALQELFSWMFGITADTMDDLRRFLPHWSRHSVLIPLGTKDGEYGYIDTSYTDPLSIMRKPLIAFFKGETWQKASVAAAGELFKPLFDEQLFTKAIIQAYANQDDYGRKIYSSADGPGDVSKKLFSFFLNKVTPGVIRSPIKIAKGITGERSLAERDFGRKYDPLIEGINMFGGIRGSYINPVESLGFAVSRHLGMIRETDTETRKIIGSFQEVEDDEIRTQWRKGDELRYTAFTGMHEDIRAARRLGVSESDIESVLSSLGLSKADRDNLRRGIYQPKDVTDRFLKSLEETATRLSGPTGRAEVQRRRRVVESEARQLPARRLP